MRASLHIHCCHDADVDAATLESSIALLDDDERRRLDALHSAITSSEFLLSRLLLRGALAARLGTTPDALGFERDAGGKPQLAAPFSHWHFNISHGGGWVALASSDAGPVGIDVEAHARRNNLRAIAQRFFSAEEQAALARRTDEVQWLEGFFATWTLKEAHAKALGCGLSKILSCSSFVVADAASPPAIELTLAGIAASAPAVETRLYRLATDTSLAISLLTEREVDVALYRWNPATASADYVELAPAATGSWRALDAASARPRA